MFFCQPEGTDISGRWVTDHDFQPLEDSKYVTNFWKHSGADASVHLHTTKMVVTLASSAKTGRSVKNRSSVFFRDGTQKSMGVLWRKQWACAQRLIWHPLIPKAINTIPLQRLLKKLSCHKIREPVSKWINNLLKDKKQSTERNDGVFFLSEDDRSMPWRFSAQYQRNSQMTKLVVTSRYYRVLKVKASCTASVVELQMQLNVEKWKPWIWKYSIFNILGWALHSTLRTNILSLW